MFEKYPIFLSDHWLITKRRVVAVAGQVVAAAWRVVVVARRVVVVAWRVVVVAYPMTSCCRRLPIPPPWIERQIKSLFKKPEDTSRRTDSCNSTAQLSNQSSSSSMIPHSKFTRNNNKSSSWKYSSWEFKFSSNVQKDRGYTSHSNIRTLELKHLTFNYFLIE